MALPLEKLSATRIHRRNNPGIPTVLISFRLTYLSLALGNVLPICLSIWIIHSLLHNRLCAQGDIREKYEDASSRNAQHNWYLFSC